METFSTETKRMIVESQHEYCAVKACLNKIHSIHHKLHNTEYNRKKFPLFIHSPMNGVGLCYEHHKNHAHLFRITEDEAEIYEVWLTNLKNGLL